MLGGIDLQPIKTTLRALREASGLSQKEVAQWLSAEYEATKPRAISDWECGYAMPNAEQLLHLCKLYRVNDVCAVFLGNKCGLNETGVRKLREFAALLEESGRYAYVPEPVPEPPRVLRLYAHPASAGVGEYMDGGDYDEIEADATVPPSADYGVRISGDSMLPRFMDRQVVWVCEQPSVECGEVGVFFYQGDAYIKRFEQGPHGARLVSINPEYEPIEISDTDSFRVFGKVVG